MNFIVFLLLCHDENILLKKKVSIKFAGKLYMCLVQYRHSLTGHVEALSLSYSKSLIFQMRPKYMYGHILIWDAFEILMIYYKRLHYYIIIHYLFIGLSRPALGNTQ